MHSDSHTHTHQLMLHIPLPAFKFTFRSSPFPLSICVLCFVFVSLCNPIRAPPSCILLPPSVSPSLHSTTWRPSPMSGSPSPWVSRVSCLPAPPPPPPPPPPPQSAAPLCPPYLPPSSPACCLTQASAPWPASPHLPHLSVASPLHPEATAPQAGRSSPL